MVKSLRIVFFGTPAFSIPTLRHLLASQHRVAGVVTRPDRPRGRGQKVSASPVKSLALEHQLPLAQPERLRDVDVMKTIAGWEPDLGVVAAYGKILPEELLAIPPLGMINVHASLLPKYRGAAPVQRAIIDGETVTGVTIMRMVKEMDAGGMLAKVARPIGSDETSDVVERDLAEMGAALLVSMVDRIAAGGELTEEIQDYMMATYAPRVTKDDGLIDWSLPAPYVHNRVRALYPWPHASAYLEGKRVILLRTRVEEASSDATPGTIIDVSRDAIHVAAGHGGTIAITELQLEGGRPLTVRDFLAGHPLQPGTRFTGP
jgi:methionyl-tRNA formyltransferase